MPRCRSWRSGLAVEIRESGCGNGSLPCHDLVVDAPDQGAVVAADATRAGSIQRPALTAPALLLVVPGAGLPECPSPRPPPVRRRPQPRDARSRRAEGVAMVTVAGAGLLAARAPASARPPRPGQAWAARQREVNERPGVIHHWAASDAGRDTCHDIRWHRLARRQARSTLTITTTRSAP